MKNKNIIKSFNAIKPTSVQKDVMLENILCRRKKATLSKKLLVPALSFALIIMFNINTNDGGNIAPAVISSRMNKDKINFSYNNKCYEESNIGKGNHLKKIGITSKIENEFLINIPVYKDKNNTTILNIGNYYITFEEINCFKNMKG